MDLPSEETRLSWSPDAFICYQDGSGDRYCLPKQYASDERLKACIPKDLWNNVMTGLFLDNSLECGNAFWDFPTLKTDVAAAKTAAGVTSTLNLGIPRKYTMALMPDSSFFSDEKNAARTGTARFLMEGGGDKSVEWSTPIKYHQKISIAECLDRFARDRVNHPSWLTAMIPFRDQTSRPTIEVPCNGKKIRFKVTRSNWGPTTPSGIQPNAYQIVGVEMIDPKTVKLRFSMIHHGEDRTSIYWVNNWEFSLVEPNDRIILIDDPLISQ